MVETLYTSQKLKICLDACRSSKVLLKILIATRNDWERCENENKARLFWTQKTNDIMRYLLTERKLAQNIIATYPASKMLASKKFLDSILEFA